MAADLTAETIRERVQASLRKRAPDSNLDSWLWQLFGATDISRDTLRTLICDPDGSCPSMPTFCRLVAHFGPDFADEVLGPLTGIHCAREPSQAASLMKEAWEHVRSAEAILSGDTVVELRGKCT